MMQIEAGSAMTGAAASKSRVTLARRVGLTGHVVAVAAAGRQAKQFIPVAAYANILTDGILLRTGQQLDRSIRAI
jgi:hypothetical protein